MYTIQENSISFYEIKKSKFITLLYQVHQKEEIPLLLQKVKNQYQDATHYCFAYKIGIEQKYSDDGEPGGTAGLPIMDIINKKNLDFILCVVVRYFGGIKLGAGGLVRSYSKAVRDALAENKIIELEEGYSIQLKVSYEEQKQIDHLFGSRIKKKQFLEQVTYELEISKQDLNLLKNFSYKILHSILMQKDY